MEFLADLLKIVLPAGLVIYGMYLTIMSFMKKEREKMAVELKTANNQIITPLRIQAGERLCLLLERITPNNLVRRVNNPEYPAREFYGQLLNEVREEFNHNLSQQVYFSDETWESVRRAVESVVTIINTAMQDTPEESRGIELARRIFQITLDQKNDAIQMALKDVKSEIRVFF
jgi:acetoin utilization deacetylase AcuC-like enzyme